MTSKSAQNNPGDHHNRIRLEKLCPKVVSDRQNAGRMPSKRRFLHFRPIIENPGLNVNFSPSPGVITPQSTIGFGQRILIRSIKWLRDPPILSWHKMGGFRMASSLTQRDNPKTFVWNLPIICCPLEAPAARFPQRTFSALPLLTNALGILNLMESSLRASPPLNFI